MDPQKQYEFAQQKPSTSTQAVLQRSRDKEEMREDGVEIQDQKAEAAIRKAASAGDAPAEPENPSSRVILRLVYGLLEQAGQWLLKEFQKDFLQRYGEQINAVAQGNRLVKDLQNPQRSVQEKLNSLSELVEIVGKQNILEKKWISSIQNLLKNFQEAVTVAHEASQCWKNFKNNEALTTKINHTLAALRKLLSTSFTEQIVSSKSLASMLGWLQMAQEWSAWLVPLSTESWDSPQAFFEVLQRKNLLPSWVSESIQKVQEFYQTLEHNHKTFKAAAETLDRLQAYLSDFKKADGIAEQLSVLIETLTDKEVSSLVGQYAPLELHSAFQLLSFGIREIQAMPVEEGSFRTTLLAMQRLMHPDFSKQLVRATSGSGVGAYLNTMFEDARRQLMPSQTMVSAMNLLVQATDHQVGWTEFAKAVMGEVVQMPDMQEFALSMGQMTVNYASGFGQVGTSLMKLLTTFWNQYSHTNGREVPTLIGQIILTDLTGTNSQIVTIAGAMTSMQIEATRQVLVCLYKLYQKGEQDITMLCALAGQALKNSSDETVVWYAWALEKGAVLGMLWKVWQIITAPDSEQAYKVAKPQLDKLKAVLPFEMKMASALLEGLSWAPLLVEIKEMGGKLPKFEQQENWIDWGCKLLEIAQDAPPLLQKQIRTLLEPWLSNLPPFLQVSMQGVAKNAGLDFTSSTPSGESWGTALLEILPGLPTLAGGREALLEFSRGWPAALGREMEELPDRLVDLTSLFFPAGRRRHQRPPLLWRGFTDASKHRVSGAGSGSSWVPGAGAGMLGLFGMLSIAAAIQGDRERRVPSKDEAKLADPTRSSLLHRAEEGESESVANHGQPLLTQPLSRTTQNSVNRVWNWLKERPSYATGGVGALAVLAAAAYAVYSYQAVTPLPEEEQHHLIEKWLHMQIAPNRKTYLDEIYDLLIDRYKHDTTLFDNSERLQTEIKSIVEKELKEDNVKLSEEAIKKPTDVIHSQKEKRSVPEQGESKEAHEVKVNLTHNVSLAEIVKVTKDEVSSLLGQKFEEAYNAYITYGRSEDEFKKLKEFEYLADKNINKEDENIWKSVQGEHEALWTRMQKEYGYFWERIENYDNLVSKLYGNYLSNRPIKDAISDAYNQFIGTFEDETNSETDPLLSKQFKIEYLNLEKKKQIEQYERIEKIIEHLIDENLDVYEIGTPKEARLLTMKFFQKVGKVGECLIPSDATNDELMEIAERIYKKNTEGYDKSTANTLFLMESTYLYVSKTIKDKKTSLNKSRKIEDRKWILNLKELKSKNLIKELYNGRSRLFKLKDIYNTYDQAVNPDYPMGFADIKPNFKVEPKAKPASKLEVSRRRHWYYDLEPDNKVYIPTPEFNEQFDKFNESAHLEAHFLITKNIVNSKIIETSDLNRPPKSIVARKLRAFVKDNPLCAISVPIASTCLAQEIVQGILGENSEGNRPPFFNWLNDVLAKDPNGSVLFIESDSGKKYVLSTLFNDFVFKEITDSDYTKYTNENGFDPVNADKPDQSFFNLIGHKYKDNIITFEWTDFTIISNLEKCSLLPGWIDKLVAKLLQPGIYKIDKDSEADSKIKTDSFHYRPLQELLEEYQTLALKVKADVAKEHYREKTYWEKCLHNNVPFAEMVQRLLEDKGYTPSVEDWIFDLIDAVVTLLTMAFPVVGAGRAGIKAANAALKQGIARGLKGQALRKMMLQAAKPHLKTAVKTVGKETASFLFTPVDWIDMADDLMKKGSKIPSHQKNMGTNSDALRNNRLPDGNSGAAQPAVRFEPYRQFDDTSNTGNVASVDPKLADVRIGAEITSKVSKFINKPTEQCRESIGPVIELLKEKNFENIKVRGMYLWIHPTDSFPSNHFVVVGSRKIEEGSGQMQEYVIDVTAAQLKGMTDFDSPLYLTESDWAKKYQNATSRKLIKYKDFASLAAAEKEFGTMTQASWFPMLEMAGATRLTEPGWYKTAKEEIEAGRKKVDDYCMPLSNQQPKQSQLRNALVPQSQPESSPLSRELKRYFERFESLSQEKQEKLIIDAMNKAKTRASDKINTAIKKLDKKKLDKNEAKQIARLFFGKDDDVFMKTWKENLEKMQEDLNKLSPKEHIRVVEEVVKDADIVAQINQTSYCRIFSTKEPGMGYCIEVSSKQLHNYYKIVGTKSSSVISNILIHEMSHGRLNTFDYTYIGVIGLNGDADLRRLVDLGQGRLPSELYGEKTHVVEITKKMTEDQTLRPGYENADSFAWATSLLSIEDKDKLRDILKKIEEDRTGDNPILVPARHKREVDTSTQALTYLVGISETGEILWFAEKIDKPEEAVTPSAEDDLDASTSYTTPSE